MSIRTLFVDLKTGDIIKEIKLDAVPRMGDYVSYVPGMPRKVHNVVWVFHSHNFAFHYAQVHLE